MPEFSEVIKKFKLMDKGGEQGISKEAISKKPSSSASSSKGMGFFSSTDVDLGAEPSEPSLIKEQYKKSC
jgi:hypothetical protein